MKTHTLPTKSKLTIALTDWVSETWTPPLLSSPIRIARLRLRTLRAARLRPGLLSRRESLDLLTPTSCQRRAAVPARRLA